MPRRKLQEPKEPRCSFCGRTAREAGRLISGIDGYICVDCIKKIARTKRTQMFILR